MGDELGQILDYEQKSKELVRLEQERLDKEIKEKEEKINEMLENEPPLTAEQIKKIKESADREMKRIEAEKKRELNDKLKELNKDKEEKVNQAVSHIISNLLKE